MKIEANTIEEFFINSGSHRIVIEELDKLILKIAPTIDRKLYNGKSICLIGYAVLPYKSDEFGGVYPIISIAPQKHTTNLYVMCGPIDGMLLTEKYKSKLGKVTVGKSCIRIKNLESTNMIELELLIRQAINWYQDKLSR